MTKRQIQARFARRLGGGIAFSVVERRFGRLPWRLLAAMLLTGGMVLTPMVHPAASATSSGTLFVWIDGWGSGTVTSSPPGISCTQTGLQPGEDPYGGEWDGVSQSGTCSASFPLGTAVTLNQTADEGSYFNGGLGTETSWSPEEPSFTQTVTGEYTPVYVFFCPEDNLCMSY